MAPQGTEKPYTFKGTPQTRDDGKEGNELDLLQRQSLLPARQPALALGLGI